MIGDIKAEASIIGEVAIDCILGECVVDDNCVIGDASVGNIIVNRVVLPNFQGPYEATPTLSEQIFPTEQKTTIQDFVVHAIPYIEVDNEAGGITAIIAPIQVGE